MILVPKPYRPTAEELVPIAWTSPWTPTEEEFTGLMLQIADAKGWRRRYHTHDSRRSTAGYPDWTMVHTGQRRVLFLELKGWAGEASQAQLDWLRDLDAAGQEAYLVKTTGDYALDASGLAELFSHRPPTRRAAAA